MNLLLTGATGFLGSHLARALVADQHKVIVLKRQSSDLRRLSDIQSKLIFHDIEHADYSLPYTSHGPIHAVMHLATCYGRANEPVEQLFEVNTLLPLRLLALALRHGVPAFINAGTSLNRTVNAYALSKAQFSDWGQSLCRDGAITFVDARLEHFFGPGDDSSKFTTWVVRQCLHNVDRLPLTFGEQRRDFIAIEDVVAAYQTILQNLEAIGPGYSVIPVGSGRAISIRSVVEMLHRMSGSRTKLDFGVLPQRSDEPMESKADISQLLTLGWKPAVSLADGLRFLVAAEERQMRQPSPPL